MPSAQKNKKHGGKNTLELNDETYKNVGNLCSSEMTAPPSLNRVTKPITAAAVSPTAVTDRDRDRPRRNRQEF